MTGHDQPPAVELQGVSFVFADASPHPTPVLQHLDLVVGQGEIVSLIGPSGCGKTTILRLIAGLLQPTGGIIRINGEVSSRRVGNCGYVPQNYSLFPWLTVRKNIEYGLQFGVSSKTKIAEASAHLLAITGLEKFADAYPNTLSGGMKQRVAIARALAVDPAIVLLDEPFGALDMKTRAEVQRYFLEMMQRSQRAALLVTHDIQEAIILSDKIVVLATRPSYAKDIILVPLARPRLREVWELSTEVAAAYRQICEEIWASNK